MKHTRAAGLSFALIILTTSAIAQTGTGLTGKYYDATDFVTAVTTRTDASINFNFGTAIPAGTAITAATTYSVAWSGQIEAGYSELYTFYVTADDAARLWVDDQLIVQRTFMQGTGEMRGQIRLKAGHRVNVRLEFIQQTGNAAVKLEWASPSQIKQVVPTNRLYPTTEIPNGGSVMREVWHGLAGASISTMTSNANYPNKPASREFITSFECIAQSWEDSFGTRVTGFIRAPVSGSYTFAVSGDEVVQLYLSTDATSANKALIASTTTATAFRDFATNASQQSAPRTLVGGQRYYVELLHKEDTGADHWSVGWKQPGDAAFSIIPGTALMMPNVDLATPSTANYFNTLATEQPRLGCTRERFIWLRQQYLSATASNAKTRAQAIVSTANSDVANNTRHYGNEIPRLALAWWLTNDPVYAEKVWTNIQETMATGDFTVKWKGFTLRQIAFAYDWLYPYWNSTRRTTLLNFLVNSGLNSQSNAYGNNIGILNDSGFIQAALAVGTGNEGAAEPDLSQAVSQLVQKIDQWEPNGGAWLEGTDYGILAKLGLSDGMHALDTALGSTFGVGRVPGFFTQRREPLTIASNTRQRFTFSDVGTGSNAGMGWASWWGRRFNALEVFDYSRQSGNSTWNALLLPETTITPAQAGLNPDTCFHGPADSVEKAGMQHVATMRQNWTDTKATFVGGMGGTYMSHGMLQSGTFQLSARGVNWFVDLKSESYEVPNHNGTTPVSGADRWDYYRNRAEGHNCLIVNPTSQPDRIWNAPSAPMIAYQSAQNGQRSFAVWDLTNNITGATKVQRGIQLLGQRKQVLIQDEIVHPTATTCWWFAHFPNSSISATISGDGSSVTLQNGTERLWGKILSGSGVWTVRAALPLPTSPAPAENANNSSYSKLSIQLTGVTNTTLAVWFVPLAPGEDPPATTPTITALNTWNLVSQNEAPIAQNSGANSIGGAPVDVDLRTLVTDDWTPATQMGFAASGAVGGTVAMQPDGFTARYTPTSGFTGAQSFTFTATDLDGATSNSATIIIGASPVITNWTSAASGSWSTAANWQSNVSPVSGRSADIQFFNGQTLAATTITATNNLAGTTDANKLTFGGTGAATTVVNVAGNPLKLVRNGATSPTITLSGATTGFSYNIANDITLDDSVTINASGTGNFFFNGIISGSGGLTRTSSTGVLILTGNNTYTGPTTISAGTLRIGNDGATGSLGTGAVTNNGALRIDRTGTVEIANDISGTGSVQLACPAVTDIVRLTGDNSFTGEVRISGGSLRVSDAAQLGGGTKNVIIDGSSGAIRFDGSAGDVVLPESFRFFTNITSDSIINEAGTNVIAGPVTLAGGSGSRRLTTLAGTLIIDGLVTPNTTGRSLDLRGAGNGVINGGILDGSATNTLVGLSKNDAGTWTLNGGNSFTGGTTVSGGKLVINGTHNSGAVTVANGATLAGRGTLSAATSVSGTLSPGDGVGTMNINNTLSFASTSHLQWELGSNSLAGDKVTSTAAVSVAAGAKIDVVLNSPGSDTTYVLSFWRSTRTWPVITGASLSGTFTLGTVSGDAAGHATATYGAFSLQHTATGVNLVWTPIPGFPIVDEPIVTFTQPTANPAALPNVESRLRVAATAAGGGTTSFVWSLVPDPNGGTGTVTFANANAADTTATFSDPGTYTLRCTATNEAVSRYAGLIVLVEPPTTAVLQEDLDGYSHRASYLMGNSTAWNHGADPQLRVGRNSSAGQRAVLGFPLDTLPAGSVIRSAKLDVWTDTTSGVGSVSALELRKLTRSFVEGTGDGSASTSGAGSGVTWANYNATTAWTTAGGDFAASALSTVAGFDATVPSRQKTFVSTLALVTAAQAALDADSALELILISPSTEADTAANNYTSLKSNDHADAAQRPRLTLDFTFNSLPVIDPGTLADAGVGFPHGLNGVVSFATSSQWSLVSGPGTATFANAASTTTTVTFSATGNYLLRLTATNALGQASRDLAVTVASVPAGFASWQSAHWPGVSDLLIIGPNADPDGDGVTNAIEFNAGTDPKSSASVPTFIWSRMASGTWSSGGSWQLGVAPASNAVTKLEFFTALAPGGTIAANNDIGGSFTLQSLALNGVGSGSTSISGGSLAFATGGALSLNSEGIAYTIASPIALNAATAVGGSSDDTLQINGVVSGAGTLTKSGPFTLSFAANNTMTGSVVLDGGAVRYPADQTTALAGLTFGASNGSANVTALTVGSLTANTLTARTGANNANTVAVGTGKTLTINGAVDISTTANNGAAGARVTFNPSGAVANSTFRVNGSGSFIVGKNNATQSTTRNTSLDMRNLATFNAGSSTTALATFQVGYYTGQAVNYEDYGINTVYLAPASIIYATSFGVGDMNGGVGGQTQSTLYLGSGANQIHATTITIGETQDISATGSGMMKWNSGVTSGSLLLAGTGATAAVTNMYVGVKTDTGSTYNHTGTADFTNGTVTGSITNLYIGYQTSNGGTSNPETFGTFKIGGGTGSASALAIGALYLGYQSVNSTTFPTTGTFEISGGSVNVTGNIEMSHTAAGIANLSILGGTVTVGGNITSLGGTETLTLDGGTLDMTGGAIGDATNPIGALTFASGTLRNVASINSTGGITKTGTGTLALEGTNTFTGATTISAGKLAVSGTFTSAITATAGTLATFGIASTTGAVSVPSGGTFQVQLDGPTPGPGYDQLTTSSSVTLGGALDIIAAPGLAPGSNFTILNKTSAGAISGTFAGLPNNSVFTADGYLWSITYTGGDGNDVALHLATAIEQWRFTNFGTIANTGNAADLFDANNDGEANFLEFATGQNPNAAGKATPTLVRNGAILEFTYTRSNAALADGVTFIVEWSDTLTAGSWSTTGVSAPVILGDNGVTQQVKVTVSAGSGVTQRFVRLNVTR